jgi:hypothetical protein
MRRPDRGRIATPSDSRTLSLNPEHALNHYGKQIQDRLGEA